ncbi:MAG: thioredoxin family protein [Candidatus Nanopelagicales bacterium]
MNVSLLYFDGCPNWVEADRHLREALALAGRGGTEVRHRRIRTAVEAEAVQFRGSPTILIDGRDPFGATGGVGLTCRLYATPDGLQGFPTVAQLVAVLV